MVFKRLIAHASELREALPVPVASTEVHACRVFFPENVKLLTELHLYGITDGVFLAPSATQSPYEIRQAAKAGQDLKGRVARGLEVALRASREAAPSQQERAA
jgi:hypothetical protein